MDSYIGCGSGVRNDAEDIHTGWGTSYIYVFINDILYSIRQYEVLKCEVQYNYYYPSLELNEYYDIDEYIDDAMAGFKSKAHVENYEIIIQDDNKKYKVDTINDIQRYEVNIKDLDDDIDWVMYFNGELKEQPSVEELKGDMNGNGRIDLQDIIILLRIYLGIDVDKYTVTFSSAGGSNINSQVINVGQKASEPIIPTKDGYTFVEWQLNGATYDFNSPVRSNITLIAVWELNQNEIPSKPTIKWRGGGGPTDEEAELFIENPEGISGWELFLVSNGQYTYIDTYGPYEYSKLFRVENDEIMTFAAKTYIISNNIKIYSEYSNYFVLKNNMWD